MSDARTIRVFVSSTFRDMQDEHEELVKRVFPFIRRRCEQRGVLRGRPAMGPSLPGSDSIATTVAPESAKAWAMRAANNSHRLRPLASSFMLGCA